MQLSRLERKLSETVSLLGALPDEARGRAVARFVRLGRYRH